jgi:hypothetical protein
MISAAVAHFGVVKMIQLCIISGRVPKVAHIVYGVM